MAISEANLEHLPPGGWADVARKDDIDRLSNEMDRRLSRMTAAFLSIGLAIFAIQVEILLNLQIQGSRSFGGGAIGETGARCLHRASPLELDGHFITRRGVADCRHEPNLSRDWLAINFQHNVTHL